MIKRRERENFKTTLLMDEKYFSKAVMFSLVELSTSSFMEDLQWGIGGKKYHGFGSGGAICTTDMFAPSSQGAPEHRSDHSIQLYFVNFSKSRISLRKYVFNKCTIKVCVICF